MCLPTTQKNIFQEISYGYKSSLQSGYDVSPTDSSRVDLLDDSTDQALEAATNQWPPAVPIQRELGISMPCALEPTPIEPFQATVVPEIKWGTHWSCDESSADLLRLLFTPGQEVQELNDANQCNDVFEPIPITYSSTHASEVVIGNDSNVPETWPERFQELVQFRKQYGHCLVSHNWIGNKALAQWVKRLRYQFKQKCRGEQTTLTNEMIQTLNKIGFVWDSQSLRWEEKLYELAAFVKEHGHCKVPSNYPQNQQLSTWIRCQRRQFKLFLDGKKTNMTTERIHKLKSLGFIFVPRNFYKKIW